MALPSVKVLLSRVRLFMTVACQASPSVGFSRQVYWSRLPFPSGTIPLVDLLWAGCDRMVVKGYCLAYGLPRAVGVMRWGPHCWLDLRVRGETTYMEAQP